MILTKEQKIETLMLEYMRAVNEPFFNEPARYCLILDLLADELERLGVDPEKTREHVDLAFGTASDPLEWQRLITGFKMPGQR